MSVALIVTRGYGTSTLVGDIRDVITRGYIASAIVVVEAPSEDVFAGTDRERRYRERRRERVDLERQLRALYTGIVESEHGDDAVLDAAATVVAPLVPDHVRRDVPLPGQVEWNLVAEETVVAQQAMLRALTKLAQTVVYRRQSAQDEEEAVMTLLLF